MRNYPDSRIPPAPPRPVTQNKTMNIQTLVTNLRNTIAGKVKHEIELQYALTLATSGERMALTASLAYLRINIAELESILKDAEQCAK